VSEPRASGDVPVGVSANTADIAAMQEAAKSREEEEREQA
jgi:hypothetical protein